MAKKEEKKFVKVLSVTYSYKLEDRSFITIATPDRIIARVVDASGKVGVIRTSEPLNVGDEIDIVSKDIREGYGIEQEIVTLTTVLRNRTQQKIIKNFVNKNKVKTK